MVLQMARPQKNSRSGVYYYRQKVPADLRQIVGRTEVSRSLRTKDPEEAKRLNAIEVRKQALEWEALRRKPEPLPQKQIVALSGVAYRDYLAMLENEPGEAEVWHQFLALHKRMTGNPGALDDWYGSFVDDLLLEHGISTDDSSRTRLINAVHNAMGLAGEGHLRRSEGDYSPDPRAERFPAHTAARDTAKTDTAETPKSHSISALFELWKRDHLADGKSHRTVGDFRQKIESFIDHVGHDDASRVTSVQVSDWCDTLRHSQQLSARTVSSKYLAALRTVFRVGRDKQKIHNDPTEGVRVRVSRAPRERSAGFTDHEAELILSAALCDPSELGRRSDHNKLAIRWGPWICAYTGARITEIMQLRREDLIVEHDIQCLRITPAAGSTKTRTYRIVPIHPHLLKMGLKEFIHSRPDGSIFFESADIDNDQERLRTRAENAGNKVREWIRNAVGVTDPAVQPNHGWRHRFKTIARDVDITPEYMDVIQGHEDGRAASDYGETTVKALWREIQKLPYYSINNE